MNDQELRRALRALPRYEASPGFTGRVLDRIAREHRRSAAGGGLRVPRPLGWRLAAAALVLATVGILAAALPQSPFRSAAFDRAALPGENARLEELAREHAALSVELAELKRLAEPPVIYLGGDDGVDLVLDLDRLAQAGGVAPRPAAYVPDRR